MDERDRSYRVHAREISYSFLRSSTFVGMPGFGIVIGTGPYLVCGGPLTTILRLTHLMNPGFCKPVKNDTRDADYRGNAPLRGSQIAKTQEQSTLGNAR